jgi:hypothetical protein
MATGTSCWGSYTGVPNEALYHSSSFLEGNSSSLIHQPAYIMSADPISIHASACGDWNYLLRHGYEMDSMLRGLQGVEFDGG